MHQPKFIFIRKTPLDSVIRDASTAAGILCIIGVGVYFQSAAMQWAGFVLVFCHLLLAGTGVKPRTLTIAEARAYLDEIEEETGRGHKPARVSISPDRARGTKQGNDGSAANERISDPASLKSGPEHLDNRAELPPNFRVLRMVDPCADADGTAAGSGGCAIGPVTGDAGQKSGGRDTRNGVPPTEVLADTGDVHSPTPSHLTR